MKLFDICNIQMGYTPRGKLEPINSADGCGIKAVQLRDTPKTGVLLPDGLSAYDLPELSDRYHVRAGDILFRSRGENPAAFLLGKEWAMPVVAILPFMIIRTNADTILPAYLAWFINQQPAQRYFLKMGQMQVINSITKRDLEELPIVLPSVIVQQQILNMAVGMEREQKLFSQLKQKRRQLLQQQLLQIAAQNHQETKQVK